MPFHLEEVLRSAYLAHVRRGEKVLLAISGGLDSTVLLHASAALAPLIGVAFEVTCVDHALRSEAAAEQDEVRSQSARLGLPFHPARVSIPASGNLEAQARVARYRALEGVRAERALHWIATAHTANDQAETLLMRLGRGTSLRGARGIATRQERLLRPLLEVPRHEVHAWAETHGLTWADDPMNRDPRFLRARVRHELMPVLESVLGPRVISSLARFAQQAAEDEAVLADEAAWALGRLRLPGGALDVPGLRALQAPLRRRVLRELLEGAELPVSERELRTLEAALASGRQVGLGRRRLASSASDVLRLSPPPRKAKLPAPPTTLTPGTQVEVLGWTLSLEATARAGHTGLRFPVTAALGPFCVRTRQPGDRVAGGGGRFHRRVQDVLVDGRVPREERPRWPLLCDARDRVLWVVGVWPRAESAGAASEHPGPWVYAALQKTEVTPDSSAPA